MGKARGLLAGTPLQGDVRRLLLAVVVKTKVQSNPWAHHEAPGPTRAGPPCSQPSARIPWPPDSWGGAGDVSSDPLGKRDSANSFHSSHEEMSSVSFPLNLAVGVTV